MAYGEAYKEGVHENEDLERDYTLKLQQSIRVPWPIEGFYLFGKDRRKWNVMKIYIDEVEDWDGNIKLLMYKQKLGLIDLYKVTYHRKEDMCLDTMLYRMDLLSHLIPRRRIITYELPPPYPVAQPPW